VSPLLVLGLFEFVRGALVITLLPMYGQFLAHFDLSVIGTAISLQYLFDNLFRIPSGWLADRFGGKWLIFIGIIISLCGLGLLYLSRNETFFFMGAALFGLGIAPVWPTVVSGIAATMPSQQMGEALSKVFIAWLVGSGLGPILINYIIGRSYKLAFEVLLGVLLIALLILITGQIPRSISPKTSSTAIFLKELGKELLLLKIIYPGMFMQTVSIGILMPVIAVYARTVLGFNATQFAYLLIGIGFVTISLLVPAGKIVDRWGIKGPLIVGFLLAALGMFLLPLQKVVIHALFVGAIIGIGYALIFPSWNSLMARVISAEKQATMWAVFMCIEGLGTATGSYVGGQMWVHFGYQAPFQISALVLAGMGIFYAAGKIDRFLKAS
jgi:DHA1 family multidrug resistance protein-like MFS transporter